MGIERDNPVERQARVDRMIKEFREAQARRATPNDTVAQSKVDTNVEASLTGEATSE